MGIEFRVWGCLVGFESLLESLVESKARCSLPLNPDSYTNQRFRVWSASLNNWKCNLGALLMEFPGIHVLVLLVYTWSWKPVRHCPWSGAALLKQNDKATPLRVVMGSRLHGNLCLVQEPQLFTFLHNLGIDHPVMFFILDSEGFLLRRLKEGAYPVLLKVCATATVTL